MKMKNEEEKNEEFFYWSADFHFHYVKTIDLADSKSVIRFFISSLDRKLQTLKVDQISLKWAKIGLFGQFSRAITFDLKKLWKIWKQIWNQLSSKFLAWENENNWTKRIFSFSSSSFSSSFFKLIVESHAL